MLRRVPDYLAADGFTTLNTVSTVSSFLLGLSILPFLYNVWRTARYGEPVGTDDPWGRGRSLEWATRCPPPRHNFRSLPRIRSVAPPSTCATPRPPCPERCPARCRERYPSCRMRHSR